MSYSLNQRCYSCKTQPTCMDGNIISAAVSIIHSLGYEKGHQGAGRIDHDCCNFQDKYAEQPETA